ncbi:hypothetical protein HOY80DRAFT_751168 [Tuber brumale]|nr:hypothetical protein HOY80DRAFT_751168 [Tuber brumale]
MEYKKGGQPLAIRPVLPPRRTYSTVQNTGTKGVVFWSLDIIISEQDLNIRNNQELHLLFHPHSAPANLQNNFSSTSTSNQTSCTQATPQPPALLPVQPAATEAARAAREIPGEDHHEAFIVIGGATLLFHGAAIMTEDTSLAVTGDSYARFIFVAKDDSRFTGTLFGPWEYTSSYDFVVKVDFVDKNGGGGCTQELREYSLVDEIPVATPVEKVLHGWSARIPRTLPTVFPSVRGTLQGPSGV